jgi:AAA domain (dynein-related subfamily)
MATADNSSNLIPMADTYLENNLNILLIGLHGTGKTQSVLDLAKRHNIKLKYYSCATLDPYTDLVGVPVPKKDANGKETLDMVRPREIDEAEIIFFDEFNRADTKTTNAVFEIIQFKSINGEPLPNLKCCWAAINPPDKTYNVEELDPALMDRFDAFIEIKPKPSVQYMVSRGIKKEIAAAVKSWWDEQNRKKRSFEDYISPRRLEKIAFIYQTTENQQAVKYALPPGGNFDISKLIENLEIAVGKRKTSDSSSFGSKASEEIQYSTGWIYANSKTVVNYLNANPNDMETHRKVIDTIEKAPLGADTIINSYASVLNVLNPALVESYFNSLSAAKKSQVRGAYQSRKAASKKYSFPELENILAKGARGGNWTITKNVKP